MARPTSSSRRRRCRNALYKNNRDGTFTDVTDKAGVAGTPSAWAPPSADYDNDGFPDLYVTAYGRATLYHNNGDGTFTDVTEKAGVAAPGWSTSAVWFDYDNDGKLDLFVCSFVEYGRGKNVSCGDNKLGRHYYCIPRIFNPTASLLFHNNGDGTFTEVSKGTDIQKALGKALGVVATDINNDGLHGPLRGQRHRPELPLQEPGRREMGRDRPALRGRVQRQRPGAVGNGRGRRRTSTETATRTSSWPTSTRRCSRSTATTATSRSPTPPTGTGCPRPRGS